jgi:hypothetical protein
LKESCLSRKTLLFLLLLTTGAVLIHGYHPWAEDAEIYLPGVEKLLNPQLFPFGSEFFQHHASLTLFPNFVAALVEISHFPLEWVLLLVHLASIFLLLLACWELSGKCFPDPKARWGGVVLVATLLSLPVAGTALYLMDQYVNPRNLVPFALILGISRTVDRKYLQAGVILSLAATIHPLMSVFALLLCIVVVSIERFEAGGPALALLLPFGITFGLASPAYHQVALSHTYHYLTKWHWYEWLGIGGPLAILWWLGRLARSRQQAKLDLLCRALIPYELICAAGALILSSSARFESLARIQPLRSLHLLYILLILFGGGILAQYVLNNHLWRWAMFFVPLCAGMWIAQRSLFPASAHIEWPGVQPRSAWAQAFVWIRQNTPVNALFALDPFHMQIAGEDANGFRVIAQRSMLADAVKDSGAVTMFPAMAEDWQKQVQAQKNWKKLQLRDFHRLRTEFGVNWLVLEQPGVAGTRCPFENEAVLVCRNPMP